MLTMMKTLCNAVVIVLCCYGTAIGQDMLNRKVTLSMSEGTIEDFLKEITTKTDYTFSYINNDIQLKKKIKLDNTTGTIKEILDVLFDEQQIIYTVRDRRVILTAKKKESKEFTLKGIVKDRSSNELLPGAHIFIKELSIGATTNDYGFYSLTLPAREYELICSYIGHQSLQKVLRIDSDLTFDFALSNVDSVLNEVQITEEPENENIVSTDMSVNKPDLRVIKNMPGFLGEVDVIKSIIQLPGVTTVGEAAPGFNVRGGGIDQNLILMDEAPVYNSSHLFGFYSVFNPDAVKDIKLYKGGIPANYGGRLSSVLDVTQKEGNNKTFEGSAGVGIVSARAHIEGPIVKEKSSFLVTARRSYVDAFLKHIDAANLDEAYFYDINTKLNYSFNARNKVYLSGYFGRDVYRLGDDVNISWGNTTGTLRWNHLFSDKLFANFTAVYSNYVYAQGEPKGIYAYEGQRGIVSYNAKADFNWYLNPKHKLDFGISTLGYELEPGKIKPVDISEINAIDLSNEHALESAAYLSHTYTASTRLSFNVGLRYSIFQNIGPNEVYIFEEGKPRQISTIVDTLHAASGEIISSYGGVEPRVSMNVRLTEKSSLKASYNRTRQYLHFISNTTAATPIDFWKASDEYLKPEVADQVALGYFLNLKENMLQTSVEVYSKKIFNLVDYKNGADLLLNPAIDAELLQGKGRAYGLELMITKTKGKLTGWAGYTLSRTERLVNGPTAQEKINNGKYYPANYDQPHKINVVAIYELNKRWTFSSNFTYNTGRPVTFPEGGYRINNSFMPYYGSRNADRLPAYHRLDLAATLKNKFKPGRKWEGSWNFSLYNVYARQNAYSVYFRNKMRNDLQSSRQTEVVQLSILGTIFPSVTYNIKF
jgi:hypothetical protein